MPTYDQEDEVLQLPDGRVMGYVQYGQEDGFPVLAIHGTPGSRTMLRPAHEFAQARGIRLISPDRPGYGLSSALNEYTPVQWVADVKILLAALKIDRFAVIGISGGGPFATAVAGSLGQRVQTLALVSPVGLFDEEVRKNWSWRNAFFFKHLPRVPFVMNLLFPIVRLFVVYAPKIPLKLFIRSLGKSDQRILAKQVHADQLLSAFHHGLQPGIKGVLADMRIFSSPPQMQSEKVLMPVLLWQGMDDLMVPPAGALRLAKAFPDVQTIILPQAGHFWIFEHIEEVLDMLLAAVKA